MRNIGKTEIKKVRPKRKPGRPATGRDPSVTIRLPATLLKWIDGKASARSETIRRLIEIGRQTPPGQIEEQPAELEPGARGRAYGRTGIIDPPWAYQKVATGRGYSSHQYPSLSLAQLAKLPVADVMNYGFLWAVTPMVEDAYKLVRAWE